MDFSITDIPPLIEVLETKGKEIGFSMPSDLHIGSLLRTLSLSKPGGHFLELGTGIGLSLAWMVDGLSSDADVISVDNDAQLISIAQEYLGSNSSVKLVCDDGSKWIKDYKGRPFDLIFADTWPGKYSEIEETLQLLKVGGFYVIDDMKAQANWPEGHQDKVNTLVAHLESRKDLSLTKFDWSTGIIIATKVEN